jgi:hypothetical protein
MQTPQQISGRNDEAQTRRMFQGRMEDFGSRAEFLLKPTWPLFRIREGKAGMLLYRLDWRALKEVQLPNNRLPGALAKS